MSGKADSKVDGWQAERCTHFGRKPRVGRWQRRPYPLVEPSQDHEVGALQTRFQETPDEDPRVTAVGRPHRLGVKHLPEQWNGVVGCHHELRGCR